MFANTVRTVALCLSIVGLALSCASEGPKRPSIEQGDISGASAYYTKYIEREVSPNGAMGMAVVVVSKDGILYNKGFGSRDPQKNLKFTTDTISNVGSVSKLFTCLSILTLVDKGLIDLDAPITTYIPEFKIKSRGENLSKITARSLLIHHAGIVNDILNEFETSESGGQLANNYKSVPALLADTYMTEEPGALMSYSNLGYSLLATIVERVSKEEFASYVENHVLKPLGMDDSSFLVQAAKKDRIARGRDQTGQLVDIPTIRDMPAGSLTTTSTDMAKFLSFALNRDQVGQKPLISQKLFDQMWTRQNASSVLDFDFSIGLTWWLTNYDSLPSETLFGHGGDLDSFHAMLQVDDKRGLGVFVMTNAIGGDSQALNSVVFEGIRTFVQVQEGFDLPKTREVSKLQVPFDPRLVGTYATQMGMMQVKTEGNLGKIKLMGNELEGVMYDDGHIEVRAKVLGIELDIPFLKTLSFEAKFVDKSTFLVTKMNGMSFGLATMIAPTPLTEAWKGRLGQWVKKDRGEAAMFEALELAVDRETGFFVGQINYGGTASYPLRIISDSEVRTEGRGRNLGATIFIEKGVDGKEVLDFFGIKMIKR